MSCTLSFWLCGLGSFILGSLLTWWYSKNKIDGLKGKLTAKADRLLQVENDYSSLRASSTEQILALKEEKNEFSSDLSIEKDMGKKYDKLKVEYDSLKSQIHLLERGERIDDQGVSQKKYNKIKDDYENLLKDYEDAIDDLDAQLNVEPSYEALTIMVKSLKKKYRKKSKKIEKLRTELTKLNKKIKDKPRAEGIEKKVKIVKSLKVNKLLDWLKNDKAYKVKKKVSKQKLKRK